MEVTAKKSRVKLGSAAVEEIERSVSRDVALETQAKIIPVAVCGWEGRTVQKADGKKWTHLKSAVGGELCGHSGPRER